MNDENELLEPLATEAGQEAIVRAIRDISSLEYAVRAEQAASTASAKAGEASQSAIEASEAEDKAKDWATKTDTYVEQETITIPPEQEGEEPTTETINLYSAKYYAALALDIYNNMSFDSVPTENSTNMVNSGVVYSALDLKADKSTTYTKTETDNLINTRLAELVASAPAALDTLQELATALGNDPNFATTIATQLGNKADKSDTYTKIEVDTALSNVQSTLTFDNVPTANSDNPVKSSGIKTALDGKQDTLTFDSTPTANSTNPVTSGGVYTALQNVNIDIDDEITEDSDNPVTSAAIYEALLNFTPSGGGGVGNASGVQIEDLYINTSSSNQNNISLSDDWTNYDFVLFKTGINSLTLWIFSKTKILDMKDNSKSMYFRGGDSYLDLNIVNNNSFSIKGGSLILSGVYGIKFSKNLSEQMYSNVLYENSSGIDNGDITLKDDWNNYNFIEFQVAGNTSMSSHNTNIFSKQFLEDMHTAYTNLNTDGNVMLIRYHESKIELFIKSYSIINIIGANNNAKLTKIIGHKLAKGGYSGIVSDARMTVKSGRVTTPSNITNGNVWETDVTFDSPMPDTNYYILAQTSNDMGGVQYIKTRVRDNEKTINGFRFVVMASGGTVNAGHIVDWIAIRPNSYTREGMVEDVLFFNSSGVNSGTINLSGNISDYDLISIQCVNKLNNNQSSNMRPYGMFSSTQLLENMQNNNSIGIWGSVRSGVSDTLKFKISGDSSIDINSQDSVNLAITKITGIKFGRYVSGVAVDTTVTQGSSNVVTSGAVYDYIASLETRIAALEGN